MSPQKPPQTPGGMRLRALREARGKSQLDVELDASLGTGYLQRLELGKVRHPERETLERILASLDSSYVQRCEILALFGYTAPAMMPDETATRCAIDAFQAETAYQTVPAYLLDCAHRLLAWNALVPHLLGAISPRSLGVLMPKLIFDPVDGFASAVVNADPFFATQVRILRYEQQRWGNPWWYGRIIHDLRQYKAFDDYWQQDAHHAPLSMRPVAPLTLDTGRDLAHFRLISETFAQDPRFRIMYYLPADTGTLRQCLGWQQ